MSNDARHRGLDQQFNSLDAQREAAVSKFTKQYLADLDRSDLWDAMGACR